MSGRRPQVDAFRSSAPREVEVVRLCRASLLVTALVVMVGDPVAAQSARDIVDEMLAAG